MAAYTSTVILGVTGSDVAVKGPVTDTELRADDLVVALTSDQIEDLKDLLRSVVVELRVLSDLVSQGMNVKDDVGLLRIDAESDLT